MIAKIERTSGGLVEALFASIDKVNAKEMNAEEARAISHTARTIVGVAALELEYRKFTSESGPVQIKSLELDHQPGLAA